MGEAHESEAKRTFSLDANQEEQKRRRGSAPPFLLSNRGWGVPPRRRRGAGLTAHGGRGQRPRLGAASRRRRVAQTGHAVPVWGINSPPYGGLMFALFQAVQTHMAKT